MGAVGERIHACCSRRVDEYVYDASFVRLRELSLAWTVPAGVAGRLGASSATLVVGGRNLALWTAYRNEWDPEAISYQGGATTFQADFGTMPRPQEFFARINVGF